MRFNTQCSKGLMPWVLAVGLSSNAVLASDDEHFQGKMPSSFVEAQALLAEYNETLNGFVQDGEITAAEMGEIHQLTYTLENALGRMEEEIERVEDMLEAVHKGSEHAEYESVLHNARQYLETSRVLLKE